MNHLQGGLKIVANIEVATGKYSKAVFNDSLNGIVQYPGNKDISFHRFNDRAIPTACTNEELFVGNEEEILKWLSSSGVTYVRLYEEEGWLKLHPLYDSKDHYWRKIGGVNYSVQRCGSFTDPLVYDSVFFTKSKDDWTSADVLVPIIDKVQLEDKLKLAINRSYPGFIPESLFMIRDGKLVNVRFECIRDISLQRLLGIW